MRHTHLLVLLMVLAVASSGCISADTRLDGAEGESTSDEETEEASGADPAPRPATSWSWSAGGHTSGSKTGALQAPGGEAFVSVSAGGHGDLGVLVKDAAGTVVYDRDFGGSGGSADSTTVDGVPGEWIVEVDVGSWSGGFSIEVQGQ